MAVARTEEVVEALLEYLVDPLLPLKPSRTEPPLETQQEVAKQMHAAVLLYNYYHREENPQLEFLEFEAFCKLAVSLKPALIDHMKYMQQTDLAESVYTESQLSVTEKAIKGACKISLALTELEDVSNAKVWPVSKVSVLLVDSNKENCLLLFGPITHGVWSVIEKFVDASEGSSKGKHTNKRKRKSEKVPTGEQSDVESTFQQIALSAVEEATGLNQSEITVLEKHVTYSLSEEKMAAYFYIMQCTQQSNEDIQASLKGVIESLQGPLLYDTSDGWMLTPVIEYYNMLPYAQIMAGWLSREGILPFTHTVNLISSRGAEKDSEMEAAEIEKVNSNGLHNLIIELENVNTNSSERSRKPSHGEAPDMGSINGDCTGADSCSKGPTGADISIRKEKVDKKEKLDKNPPKMVSDGVPPLAYNSSRKEFGDKEKPHKCIPENPSGGEVQDKRGSMPETCTHAFPCCKEPTGAENSNRKEEVEKPDMYSPEKPTDREATGADSSNKEEEVDDREEPDNDASEKSSDREVKDNWYGDCNVADSCVNEPTGAENSNRMKECDKKPDKYSPERLCNGEPTGAENCNEEEVDDKEKCDKKTSEKPNDMEVQDNRCDDCAGTGSCGKEPTRKESSNKEEVDDTEKPGKYSPEMPSDGELTAANKYNGKRKRVDDSQKPQCALEKPSDGEVQDDRVSIYVNCTSAYSCSKEPIEADSFNRKEEADDEEKPDKCSPEISRDGEPIGGEKYNREGKEVNGSEKPNKCAPEKPSDGEVQDHREIIYGNCTGADTCSREPIGADSFNWKEEVNDKEKPDTCCDITKPYTISFSNADAGALKMTSAEELQGSPTVSSKRQKTDVDGIAATFPTRGKNRNACMPIRVYRHQKKKIYFDGAPDSSVAVSRCNMETSEAMNSKGSEFIDGKAAGICTPGSFSSPLNDIPAAGCALVPYEPNANGAAKLQTVMATKEIEISETALKVLLQKREEMCHQQRILEDKIALCSKDIQKIIDGEEDALALKLEAMIDYCNDACLKGKAQVEGEIHQGDVQRRGQCSTRSRQPDSILTFQSSCQELDDICHANNWRLPRYSVSASTGGFVANVTMKELDFDFSFDGALLSTPQAARGSAAALMVAKLREI